MRHMLAIFVMMFALSSATAENLLAVAPLRLLLSDVKSSDMLTLTNRSEHVRTYKIVVEDQVMQPNGSITKQDDFAYSAKRMLRFMPREVTLQPGQRQNVRVMATVPSDLADGDYHSHIIFEEVPVVIPEESSSTQGFKVAIGSLYSMGIPVIVSHGKTDASLTLGKATLTEAKGKPTVVLQLVRQGNAQADGTLQVVDKKTQDSLAPLRQIHMYREVDNMSITLPLATQNIEGRQIAVRLVKDGKVLSEADVAP